MIYTAFRHEKVFVFWVLRLGFVDKRQRVILATCAQRCQMKKYKESRTLYEGDLINKLVWILEHIQMEIIFFTKYVPSTSGPQ